MRTARAVLLFASLCLFMVGATYAVPYAWQSKNGETGFELDVPEAWRIRESVKRNGVITQFQRGDARIEVRSVGGEILAGDLIEVARHPISGSACIIQALQVPRFGALRH